MANRCPGCNKFPAYQAEDPEVETLEVDDEGNVTGTVHLTVVSECCNETMREASLDIATQVDLACPSMPKMATGNGFHVETYGGGQYTSVAWYKDEEDAKKHVKDLTDTGRWNGMPPRITPGRQLTEPPKAEVIPHTVAEKVLGVHESALPPEAPEMGDQDHPCIDGHDLSVEEEGLEAVDKYEGKGRGARHFYGYHLTAVVKCSQCDDVNITFEVEDYIQFSSMDSCD
jgi:hypothetical protein